MWKANDGGFWRRVGTLGAPLILGLLVAGCRPVAPAAEPGQAIQPAGEGPPPEAIQVFSRAGEKIFRPGDEGYQALSVVLASLLGTVDSQARTFYTSERFQLEVEGQPHVRTGCDDEVTWQGQGIAVTAGQVVLVVAGGEPLIGARTQDVADWSVYLSQDQGAIGSVSDVVNSVAGVDLRAGE